MSLRLLKQIHFVSTIAMICVLAIDVTSEAQEKKPTLIPHAQDKPPNEPRDPQTAAKMMTVPEGFSVEVVAAEPDIVNPVAMAIDERGRFWITESLEYPRKAPGPGKDRVKVLEDTDGDGKCDKFTVFLDGLNIPSGVAVGHGGVWIANAPDILFVPDADRDGVPDGPPQVVVTGFGRSDTHELPNSLTWGPDGWLYGLNGVFNFSNVTYPKDSPWLKSVADASRVGQKGGDKETRTRDASATPRTEFKFTCAMFRIHPRTREFQVFCEGTSNPWGIAFNDEGEAFISACVIDHLWHLVETGYYHRQGGPYPPFTWKIDSIVKHKHQKAAYCGIHYFDSDAYPEKYRGKLYMGNIHGGCINVDRIERDGSTYKGFGEDDFLTANDAWFMPVVQKTGPDGCLYILDWYDRYHCYQDANRDPAGIDRLKGRLYRVRYNGKDVAQDRGRVAPQLGAESRSDSATKNLAKPRVYPQIDLAKETDEQLIERLGAKNDFIRWTATRMLQERDSSTNQTQILARISGQAVPPANRMQALFALSGMTLPQPEWNDAKNWYARLRQHDDAAVQAWAIRLLANRGNLDACFVEGHWLNRPAVVALQFASATSKLPKGFDRVALTALIGILANHRDDRLIPHIVWQNLHPRLDDQADDFVALLGEGNLVRSKPVADLMPRVAERILGRQKFDAQPIAKLFALLRDDHPQVAKQVIELLSAKVQSGELKGDKLDQLKVAMEPVMKPMMGVESKHPLRLEASLLSLSWGDRGPAVGTARSMILDKEGVPAQRLAAFNALISAKDGCVAQVTRGILSRKPAEPSAFVVDFIAALGRMDSGKLEVEVGNELVTRFAELPPELQSSIIELLTQRAGWSKKLLAQVGEKKILATAINVNQARRIQALKDKDLNDLLSRHWGQVRDTRNPDREKVVAEMKSLIRQKPGDPFAGEKVFKRVCAACHKIYGEGPDIGPDITSNGRNDFNQLLSNVFDPSLVIGAGYRVCTVVNKAGRVQSGLLVEDSPQRVVLKPAAVLTARSPATTTPDAPVTVAVGKLEIIPRDDIDEFKLNELSLMPEGLEKQLTPQEIVDLFSFLTLDKHPSDKSAKRLPGVSAITPRDSTNPAEFPSLIAEVLPGFTTSAVGEGGVALLNNHFGRDSVLRTHPVSRDAPCVLTQMLTPPAGKKTTLLLDVSHDPRGDWRLVIRGNGERLADEMISKETCSNGWRKLTIDLSKFAGQELTLGLVNQANDWSFEFAYWGLARIVSE
ncbi:MAG: c-type cytochrome [Planctomycetia bacterium]|nr:c-type cytochrome [Planctomycetia bacterium]